GGSGGGGAVWAPGGAPRWATRGGGAPPPRPPPQSPRRKQARRRYQDLHGDHFVNGLTTSRAQSMKSFTTGVSVRFRKVMTPTGQGGIRRSTGRTLSRGRLTPNRNSEAGRVPTYGPLGRLAQRKDAPPHAAPFGGNFRPRARNASATSEPTVVSGSGRHQGSSDSSVSSTLRRWAHRLFGPATTTMRS